MNIWKKAKLIRSDNVDFAKTLNNYSNYISNSKELFIIAPIFSKIYLDITLDSLLKNNGKLELITTDLILNLAYQADSEDIFYYLVNEGKIKVYLTDDIMKIFLTSADNFASLFLFFDDKYYDDSSMVIMDDEKGILGANSFFNYYKNKILNK